VYIAIVTIAYAVPEALPSFLRSARSTRHDIQFHLFLHSQVPEVMATCETASREYPITYYPYGVNRGLSTSWNEGILNGYGAGADLVIVSNDDIMFGEGDVDAFAEDAARHPEQYVVWCSGFNVRENVPMESHGFSCFAINPIALERLGCFDENIRPIYFEDIDYMRRAQMLGVPEGLCRETRVRHAGSATTRVSDEIREQLSASWQGNEAYFRRKWGLEGDFARWREESRFAHPFNNPAFDCYIAPERRHAPYGSGYDRQGRVIGRM
jgi:GT2 family glycosyltransferase